MIGGDLYSGFGTSTLEERRIRLLENLDVLGMMGGKYVISGSILSHPDLTLRREERVSEYGIPLYLYEYMKARPVFYIATTTIAHPHSSFSALVDAQVSFNNVTFLDCITCSSRAQEAATIKLVERGNGSYRFHVSTNTERYVVLSESFLPGWHAWIDGNPVSIIRANGLYMAILVPTGEHSITFEYQGLFDELKILRRIGIVE